MYRKNSTRVQAKQILKWKVHIIAIGNDCWQNC